MSGVFQNIDPPTPLTARQVCPPPAPKVGGQYFRRRQTQICTLQLCAGTYDSL
jgi:hypothetical protein